MQSDESSLGSIMWGRHSCLPHEPLQLEIEGVRCVTHEPFPQRHRPRGDLCATNQANSQQVMRIIFWQWHLYFVNGAKRPGQAAGVHLRGKIAAMETR